MLLAYRSRDRDGEDGGGGGGGGGGAAAAFAKREEERARERKNHKTKRRKDSTFWDVAPRGFEHISPLQYKAMQGEGEGGGEGERREGKEWREGEGWRGERRGGGRRKDERSGRYICSHEDFNLRSHIESRLNLPDCVGGAMHG